MAFIVSAATARHFAKQAYRLLMRSGLVMQKAVTTNGIELKLECWFDDDTLVYRVSWMQAGEEKCRHIRAAKSWL